MLKLFYFALVGTAGFLIDTLFLYLFKEFLGLYLARAISFSVAVFATWFLNRRLTFKEEAATNNKGKEFFNYLAFMLIGGVVNYSSYSISVFYSSLMATYPVFAVAIGSICGLAVNFTTSSLFVFKKKQLP